MEAADAFRRLSRRYADAKHPNGTIEVREPGLMVGYIDQFKMAPDGQLRSQPPTASWLSLCYSAIELFPKARQGRPAHAA